MLWFLLGCATSALFVQLPLSSDFLSSDIPNWSLLLLALMVAGGLVATRKDPEVYPYTLLPNLVGLFQFWNVSLSRLGWAPLIYSIWLSTSNLALREPRSPLLLLGQLQIILAPCWLLREQTGFSTPLVPTATALGLALWLWSLALSNNLRPAEDSQCEALVSRTR